MKPLMTLKEKMKIFKKLNLIIKEDGLKALIIRIYRKLVMLAYNQICFVKDHFYLTN